MQELPTLDLGRFSGDAVRRHHADLLSPEELAQPVARGSAY